MAFILLGLWSREKEKEEVSLLCTNIERIIWLSEETISVRCYTIQILKNVGIAKDLCRYGQNTQFCQLQGRGDSKPPTALLKPNIFLTFFVKIISYAHKTWGHDPICCFPYLCRKFKEVRVFGFFELYSKELEPEIHRKMPIFEQLKNQILVNSKPFLTLVLMWTF